MGRDEDLGAVAAAQRNLVRIDRHGTVRNGPKAIGLGVPAGENGDHPRPRQRAADVDADDAGVRVRRADDEGMGLPGEVDVVSEPALAGDQPCVLAAADGLAEALRGLVGAGIEEGHVGTVTIGTVPIKPLGARRRNAARAMRRVQLRGGARWSRSPSEKRG